MSLEVIIRPFAAPDTDPTPFHAAGVSSAPPVRFSIGLVGGNKTFSFSQSSSESSYMAAVHTEASQSIFNMSTGALAQ
jgi:hypothetical protein